MFAASLATFVLIVVHRVVATETGNEIGEAVENNPDSDDENDSTDMQTGTLLLTVTENEDLVFGSNEAVSEYTLNLQNEEEGTLSGRVQRESAEVVFDRNKREAILNYDIRSGEKKSIELELPPGNYELTVSRNGCTTTTDFTIYPDRDNPIQKSVTLPPKGLVIIPTDDLDINSSYCSVLTEDGNGWEVQRQTTHGEQLTFELPAQCDQVEFQRGIDPLPKQIDLDSGDRIVHWGVSLEAGDLKIQTSVSDIPTAGIDVTCTHSDTGIEFDSTTTGSKGTVVAADLPVGKYVVEATVPENEQWFDAPTVTATVEAGSRDSISIPIEFQYDVDQHSPSETAAKAIGDLPDKNNDIGRFYQNLLIKLIETIEEIGSRGDLFATHEVDPATTIDSLALSAEIIAPLVYEALERERDARIVYPGEMVDVQGSATDLIEDSQLFDPHDLFKHLPVTSHEIGYSVPEQLRHQYAAIYNRLQSRVEAEYGYSETPPHFTLLNLLSSDPLARVSNDSIPDSINYESFRRDPNSLAIHVFVLTSVLDTVDRLVDSGRVDYHGGPSDSSGHRKFIAPPFTPRAGLLLSIQDVEHVPELSTEPQIWRGSVNAPDGSAPSNGTSEITSPVAVREFPLYYDKEEEKDPLIQLEDALKCWQAQSMEHDRIVSLYDWLPRSSPQTAEYAYIATEFPDGGTLRQHLDDGPLPWEDAVFIIRNVAEVLSKLHDNGIEYRCLSPDRVYFRQQGETTSIVPKLADVGLWEFYRDRLHLPLHLEYAAPEEFKSVEATPSHATDIYRAGALLYEMITGVVPHHIHPVGDRIVIHPDTIDQYLPLPSEYTSSAPEWIDQYVVNAMHPDPTKRDLSNLLSIHEPASHR